MKLTKNQEEGQEYLQSIISKAWEDNNFKQDLIANPLAAMEKVIGKKMTLPNDKKIIVEDQTNQNIIYINIPKQQEYDNLELTDEQLEIVAGGELVFIAGVGIGLAIVGLVVGGIALAATLDSMK